MKKHITLLLASATAVGSALAASYSTEATMTPTKTNNQCEVVVRVSQLVERNGKIKEEVISAPRILTKFGTPGAMYVGLQPGSADYHKQDNVSVDVSWPEAGKSGLAVCTVTIKRGDKIVSKSKLQVMVEDK